MTTKQVEQMVKGWDIDDTTLYDDSDDDAGNDVIRLMPGLSAVEKFDAVILAKYFWRGLVLVTGLPGSGKDLFVKSTCWKMRRYFGRHILLDDRPRRLFGPYLPFNEQVLRREMKVTDNIAKGKVKQSAREMEFMQQGTDEFREFMLDKGTSWMRNSVLGLAEYQGYMSCRNPMARMTIAMGSVNRLWRHLGITIFGIVQNKDDLDAKRCLPYVTTEVRCVWMGNDTVRANIYQCKYVSSSQVLQTSSARPYPYQVNGGKINPNLIGVDGKAKRYFDLWNSINTLKIGEQKL